MVQDKISLENMILINKWRMALLRIPLTKIKKIQRMKMKNDEEDDEEDEDENEADEKRMFLKRRKSIKFDHQMS